MPLDDCHTDDKSILVQAMARCRQAKMTPYGVTRSQRVNSFGPSLLHTHVSMSLEIQLIPNLIASCGQVLNYSHKSNTASQHALEHTVGELRSTENARCRITTRFVYEYATLYLLHATPYVRMLRRIYDSKRVSRINYTIFPRYLDANSCVTTYLGKLIIHNILLQPPNTMYLPGIEVSDDITSLYGDGPAWKSPDAELSQHIAFQKHIYEKANSLIQVVLLDTSTLFYLNEVSWLFIWWKQWSTALFTNCFMDPHVIRSCNEWSICVYLS